jgi:hypothetical protein
MHSDGISGSTQLSWDAFAYSCREYAQQNHLGLDTRRLITKILELHNMTGDQNRRTSIFVNLLHFHDTVCRDERDRLYCLFAISRRDLDTSMGLRTSQVDKAVGSIQFSVNYDLSLESTYYRFAIAAMRSSHAIALLHCAGAFPAVSGKATELGSKRWPSWVPDWRAKRLYHPLLGATRFRPAFPLLGPLNIKIDERAMCITMLGFRVGIVAATYSRLAVDKLPEAFDVDYVRDTSIDMSLDRVGIRVSDPSSRSMAGRASPRVKIGDIVVTFATALTPFILRQYEDMSFRLICDCYLPGAMVVGGEQAPKLGKVERFTIS